MNKKMQNPVINLVPLISIAILMHAPHLAAQEVVLGWEGSSARGYGFVSPVLTLQKGEQTSWLLRGAVSYLYYDSRDIGGTTQIRSPGESLGIAFRYSGSQLTATFGPGYEIRQTRRRLASGVEARKTERGATVQGDMFFQATPLTNVSLIAAYGDANKYFWVRGGVKQQISNFTQQSDITLHAGVELTRQGNEDIKTSQAGGVFEFGFPQSRSSLQLRSGYLRREDPNGTRESGPYFGVGFYRGF